MKENKENGELRRYSGPWESKRITKMSGMLLRRMTLICEIFLTPRRIQWHIEYMNVSKWEEELVKEFY